MSEDNKGYQTGMASEYLVLSMLYRKGFDAYLTLGNKKSVDIIIKKDNGSIVTIDVKSVRGYDSIPVKNVKEKDGHFIVIVIYNNKFGDVNVLPDFYIVHSQIVVERRVSYDGGQTDLFKRDIKDYKDCWNLIKG